MPRSPTGELINRLYELPPGDFTRERNALAKEVGGEEGKRIRSLPRPPASAWAVNQLYWRDRETYEDLVAASDRLRTAHQAVLGGKKADLVGADAAHREAVKAAIASTLRLAKENGQSVSSATHNEIARTLETLSPEDQPGRLSKPLSPEGFEALRGMPIRARARSPEDEPKRPTRAEEFAGPKPKPLALVKPRKETQRKLAAARKRERKERAAVTALEKHVAAAARKTAASKTTWDRAQANEANLRNTLREAQRALEETEAARRELENELSR